MSIVGDAQRRPAPAANEDKLTSAAQLLIGTAQQSDAYLSVAFITCHGSANAIGCASSSRLLGKWAIQASTKVRIYFLGYSGFRKACDGVTEPPVGRTNTTARLQAIRSHHPFDQTFHTTVHKPSGKKWQRKAWQVTWFPAQMLTRWIPQNFSHDPVGVRGSGGRADSLAFWLHWIQRVQMDER